jgi:hypothetical protein
MSARRAGGKHPGHSSGSLPEITSSTLTDRESTPLRLRLSQGMGHSTPSHRGRAGLGATAGSMMLIEPSTAVSHSSIERR